MTGWETAVAVASFLVGVGTGAGLTVLVAWLTHHIRWQR